MKKAICLIMLAVFLATRPVLSFAQYRKSVHETSEQDLQALTQEQRDKFERDTRRTQTGLSAVIGQNISMGLDGLTLLKLYYPHLLAAIEERVNRAVSDPMYMLKSTNAELPKGTMLGLTTDPLRMGWAMISFVDELVE